MKLLSTLYTALAAVLIFGIGSAQAATCTAAHASTNPDATLTDSTSCGAGTAVLNDNAAQVNIAEPSDSIWTLLDKDENAGDGTSGVLHSTPVGAGYSGEWGIDTGLTGVFDEFLIVIKDGNTGGPRWFWFMIDTAAGCSGANTFSSLSYCGDWSMYGTDGTPKNISHLTLYGHESGITITETPEPAILLLFGSGLIGFSFLRRRKS